MNIYEKLLDIQQKLVVSKSKYNKFAEFNYRSCEDILQAVKPLLSTHKLLIILNDGIEQVGERFYIKATATLTDGENKIETSALAREPQSPKAKMDESQTTGSTSSYARKYALNGLFALDDNADSDADKKQKEIEKTITKVQKTTLEKYGVSLEDVAKYLKVATVDEIPFAKAKQLVDKKTKEQESKEKINATKN